MGLKGFCGVYSHCCPFRRCGSNFEGCRRYRAKVRRKPALPVFLTASSNRLTRFDSPSARARSKGVRPSSSFTRGIISSAARSNRTPTSLQLLTAHSSAVRPLQSLWFTLTSGVLSKISIVLFCPALTAQNSGVHCSIASFSSTPGTLHLSRKSMISSCPPSAAREMAVRPSLSLCG
jgi:hypothetical protein